MYKILPITSLLIVLFGSVQLADAQSISRSVNASAAETLSSGQTSITFVLGESVADLFANSDEQKYLTTGFNQPDVELKQLAEAHPDKPFIVYPNPTRTGLIKLVFNDLPEATYSIEIIDGLGRVLQSQTAVYVKNSFLYMPLDISAYAKGVYFVRVKKGLTVAGQVKLIKI
jgi:hypothetical protein